MTASIAWLQSAPNFLISHLVHIFCWPCCGHVSVVFPKEGPLTAETCCYTVSIKWCNNIRARLTGSCMKQGPKQVYKAQNVVTTGLRLIGFVVKQLVALSWQQCVERHRFAAHERWQLSVRDVDAIEAVVWAAIPFFESRECVCSRKVPRRQFEVHGNCVFVSRQRVVKWCATSSADKPPHNRQHATLEDARSKLNSPKEQT